MRYRWMLPLAAATGLAGVLPLRSPQQLVDPRLTPGSYIRFLALGAGAPLDSCRRDRVGRDTAIRLTISAWPPAGNALVSTDTVTPFVLRLETVRRLTPVRDTFAGTLTLRDSVTWRTSGAVELSPAGGSQRRTAWLRFRAFSGCLPPPRDIFDLAARRGSMEFTGAYTVWRGDSISRDSISAAGTAVFHQPIVGLLAEQPLPLAGSGLKARPASPVIDSTRSARP